MLIEKIKNDLTEAMKAGNDAVRNALRMVIGEIPRLNLKKDQQPSDEQVYSIIRKLIKSEMLVCEYSGQDSCDNEYITILDSYLPQMMSKAQIQQWIVDYINLSEFNPKVKAMGLIMKHLKGKADGALVRKVLNDIDDFLESK